MAEKNKGLGLPQQKGTFQLKGIVTGVGKDKFFVEKKTTSNKDFRNLSFGVKVSPTSTQFVGLNGMVQDNVYFSKRGEKGEKATVEKVAWKDRYSFRKEGFGLIGVNVGIEKTTSDKGQEVNDIKHMTPFDAAKYISEHLVDGMSVYIRGNIEYSHYTNPKDETQHSSKLIITQISLCKPVDFDEKDFLPTADFEQNIVYTGGRKEGDNFILDALVINFQTVENVEFEIHTKDGDKVDDAQLKLAKNIKGLKPYTAIKVHGNIENVKNTDTVESEEEDNGWGEKSKMERVTGQYKKVLVITGADKDSLDSESYSESKIDTALESMKANSQADKDFGGSGEDDWSGGAKGKKPTEDEDNAW